jgi:hypothetical protein
MRNQRYILASVLILFIGVIYFTLEAQQKNVAYRNKFTGEWKSKEPISIGGNILCSYVEGDRMNSKIMKIVQEPNFLIIENPNSHPEAKYPSSKEKLIIDGKESQINHGLGNEKKFSVKLSADGQTMTIKSIAYFMTATPYHVNVMKKAFTDLTEVWKLSTDGKHITVQSIAKSNVWDGERSWKTVFNKTN